MRTVGLIIKLRSCSKFCMFPLGSQTSVSPYKSLAVYVYHVITCWPCWTNKCYYCTRIAVTSTSSGVSITSVKHNCNARHLWYRKQN